MTYQKPKATIQLNNW